MKAIDKCLSVAFFSSFLIILGNYVITSHESLKKLKLSMDPVNISMSTTIRSILDDFESNPARFDINWSKKYVIFYGNVTQIGEYDIILSN